MSKWNTTNLKDADCFEYLNGLWKGKKPPFEKAVVIRNTNFRDDGILDLQNVAVLDVESRQLENRRLKKGDIIIERSGGGPKQPVGRVCFFDIENSQPHSFSNFTTTLRVKDTNTYLPLFVHYYLLHLYNTGFTIPLQRATTGIRNLDFATYQQAEVPKPPKLEQRRIVAVLWKVQRAIETEDKLIATVRELKQSAMHKLFTHGVGNESQKETEIGKVPASWELKQFDGFATLQRGQDLTRSSFRDGPIPVVGATRIIGYHDTANVKGPGVTVVRSGSSAGKPLYIKNDFWAHNVVLYVKDFHGNLPLFVYYKICNLELQQFRSGVAVPTLNRNTFSSEILAVPLLHEQQEIANILETVDRNIEVHERKRAILQDLFKTLLHNLMTGEICVADLDIDVTEVKS